MRLHLVIILALLPIIGIAQRVAPYTPWYAPSMYRNLEKYWWYRYRLVNDFMKVGTGCGESIPMEKWAFSSPDNVAYWGDATQHLGNYINTLAGEWKILHDCGLSTQRTEEELYKALYAFERLDKKAEPSWRNYDNTYPYCGGEQVPGAEQPNDINGFFIRDDVPSLRVSGGTPQTQQNFIDQNAKHFSRDGFYYRTSSALVESGYGPDVNTPGHTAGVYVSNPSYPYQRGPSEVSQDQIVMLYAGMGMVSRLLGSNVTYGGGSLPVWDLREKAREQIYRMLDWPGFHACNTPQPWVICNPITNKCVGDQTKNCNSGGGQMYANAVGAVDGLGSIGLPASLPHSYSSMSSHAHYSAFWESTYQAQQYIPPTQLIRSDDLFYANTYAAFANNWGVYARIILWPFSTISIRFTNTTQDKIVNHATARDFAWPQLPLMWQIVHGKGPGSTVWFNPKEKKYGYQPTYPELLDYAPFCGCHFYDANTPSFRSTIPHLSYGTNEDYIGQNAWQWAAANRLQDFAKRGWQKDNSDYNNLDYMTVFNLFAVVEGKKAISYMVNPYYWENYNYNWGTTGPSQYGTIGFPLKLNYLQYISFINKIGNDAHLKVRCGQVIEFKPGFEAKTNYVFDAVVKDYRCQEEGYVYALGNYGAIPATGRASSSEASQSLDTEPPLEDADTNYVPLDFPPDGVPFNIDVDSDQFNNFVPNQDSILEEDEIQMRDSLMTMILESGDSSAIQLIQPWLDSMSGSGGNVARAQRIAINRNRDIQVYPIPNNGNFTIRGKEDENYQVQILNSIGRQVYQEEYGKTPFKSLALEGRLPNGVYLIIVTSANNKFIRRMTIVH